MTVADSPGASHTFWNPFSSFTGRVTELTRSRTYSWTTSLPARAPLLVTVARTRVAPSAVIVSWSSRTSLSEKVV